MLVSWLVLVALALPAADAVKLTRIETAPKIDGSLDDAVWQAATPWSDFKTSKPDYGKPVSEKTEIYMAYDRENIYFAFRCLDSEPGKIKTSMSRRDNIDSDDWIGVALDTFADQQNG
ncbi:MAG TPA: hypothetical protein VF451_03345, partial [Acidobacteriota bacterium]